MIGRRLIGWESWEWRAQDQMQMCWVERLVQCSALEHAIVLEIVVGVDWVVDWCSAKDRWLLVTGW